MTLQLLLEELIVYEDKECYVIPGYLPLHSDDEAYKWLTWGFEGPNFVLKFERFIPFGLINQIIAYYGREEGALKRYWRDQVIFTAGREMDEESLFFFSRRFGCDVAVCAGCSAEAANCSKRLLSGSSGFRLPGARATASLSSASSHSRMRRFTALLSMR